jgi:hypothetical protein
MIALMAAIAFAGLLVQPLHAANLVADGGFEQADPTAPNGAQDYNFTPTSPFDTSWTVGGVVGIDTTNKYIYDGSKSLYLDPDPTVTSSISQVLSTTLNQNYVLTFWADDDQTSNPLTVTLLNDGSKTFNITPNGYPLAGAGANANQFTKYTYNFNANTQNLLMTFSATNNGSGEAIELDDINVTPVAAPETSTVVGFGVAMLGMCGLALFKRRRKTVDSTVE